MLDLIQRYSGCYAIRRFTRRLVCKHDCSYRTIQIGQALPGLTNPLIIICMDCGAVTLKENKESDYGA